MDYKEKYELALEKAMKLYERGTITESLSYLFPELKESEDEKIRKGLINGFNECLKNSQYSSNAQKYWHNIKIEDIFTWLEKQGEQKLYVNDNAKEMFIKALERVEEQNNKGYKLTDCDKNSWWEDNGYKKIDSANFHYYGCDIAKLNRLPVYRKRLYICHDMEEDSMVEVFPCEIGGVQHEHIVAIHTWNNAGGSKFSLDIAKQVSTIDSFNALITDYIGEELENGTYLLRR